MVFVIKIQLVTFLKHSGTWSHILKRHSTYLLYTLANLVVRRTCIFLIFAVAGLIPQSSKCTFSFQLNRDKNRNFKLHVSNLLGFFLLILLYYSEYEHIQYKPINTLFTHIDALHFA